MKFLKAVIVLLFVSNTLGIYLQSRSVSVSVFATALAVIGLVVIHRFCVFASKIYRITTLRRWFYD